MTRRRAAAALGGAIALTVPVVVAAVPSPTSPATPASAAAAATLPQRDRMLDQAAAWRDVLDATRAPALPTPGDTAAVILVLRDPPAARAAPGERAAAAATISAHQAALEPVLAQMGATITFRYRILLDGLAVTIPADRVESLGSLAQVAAVVPVGYLAPAQIAPSTPSPLPAGQGGAPIVAGAADGPAHVALIDGGVDASHPWLGGGMGPTFPVIGGWDLVDGDTDPSPGANGPAPDGHGTQMASLVLRDPALAGLSPASAPRLIAMRVVAPEAVGGRVRAVARTDRVLAALERAVDPNGDGDPVDRADVILLGVAGAFDGGGLDPVAEALRSADRVGSTVVAPAGNDGPTFARPGSVGGPAAAATVIAVGGASAGLAPRTAHLDAALGPAAARLAGLPLMGPDPMGSGWPVVALRDDAGIADGSADRDFRAADGRSRVEGTLALVTRGTAPIAEVAARAAGAGARAVAVWDETGDGGFPAVPGDGGLPIPVVGLGPSQGAALLHLAEQRADVRVSLAADPVGQAPIGVASFSSWGPTPDGRQKPDLIAPSVAIPAAWPATPGGGAGTATLTGTSAAAAHVAALALRLRIDRPQLGPDAVRSLLVASARPLPGVATERQGAGLASAPAGWTLRIAPAIVAARTTGSGVRAPIVVAPIAGAASEGRIRFALRRGGAELPVGEATLGAAARRLTLRLPAAHGLLIVRDAGGVELTQAPVVPSRPAHTWRDALSDLEVHPAPKLGEVRVRIGVLRRADGRLRSTRLHGVRIELIPQPRGQALLVAGGKGEAAWPAATYRFLIAPRLANGLAVPAGRYRVRVSGRGPDGRRLTISSPAMRLHP